MIKVAFFDTKEYDRESFEIAASGRDIEIKYLETKLTEDTADLAKGFDIVCVFAICRGRACSNVITYFD